MVLGAFSSWQRGVAGGGIQQCAYWPLPAVGGVFARGELAPASQLIGFHWKGRGVDFLLTPTNKQQFDCELGCIFTVHVMHFSYGSMTIMIAS